VAEGAALVRLGEAVLLVTDGNRATVQWAPEARHQDDDPSWLLQGWAVTLAMLQRGWLSVHAATVQVGSQVVAIAGARGAGKSTTAMALRRRGHRLLVDDVTLVQCHDRRAWVQPFWRNVHLLPDAASQLDLDFGALPMLAGGRAKAAFRPEGPPGGPLELDQIVVLEPREPFSEVSLTRVRGASRMTTLAAHTSRDGTAPLILGPGRYFQLLGSLADSTPVHLLRRPRGTGTLDDVLNRIEEVCLAQDASGSSAQRSGMGENR
jgi:hypothetical protein